MWPEHLLGSAEGAALLGAIEAMCAGRGLDPERIAIVGATMPDATRRGLVAIAGRDDAHGMETARAVLSRGMNAAIACPGGDEGRIVDWIVSGAWRDSAAPQSAPDASP